jgi:DNA polymerase (family 10)
VDLGATLVIDSDAHGVETQRNVEYGVFTARRAWITAANVANTRTWDELQALPKQAARSKRARPGAPARSA